MSGISPTSRLRHSQSWAIAQIVRSQAGDVSPPVPAKPFAFGHFLDRVSAGLDELPVDLLLASGLQEVRAALYHPPAHRPQAELVWREAVATALFAARVARLTGLSASVAALAGLLHRAGEVLALGVIAVAEKSIGATLDSGSRARLIQQTERAFSAALVRQWQLPAAVGAAVLGWRQMSEFGVITREAMAVYFGHLLAVETIHPEFCAPGLADSVGAGLGISAQTLLCLRQQGEHARQVLAALEITN